MTDKIRWLNRADKRKDYSSSPSTMTQNYGPDFRIDWIEEPAVPAVADKYWVIDGDIVTEMTPEQKEAVDAAEILQNKQDTSAQIEDKQDLLRAIVLVLLSKMNSLSQTTTKILNAVDSSTSLAELKTKIAAISDEPNITFDELKQRIMNSIGE